MDAFRYGFHPYLPERLGYRRLLSWLNPDLSQLLHATDSYSLVTARKRVTIYREAEQVLCWQIPGDFVEIGVHRGGTAALLAELLKSCNDRHLHLFDRWGDLPDPTIQDGAQGEAYRKDKIGDKLEQLKRDPPLPAAQRLIHQVIGFPEARTHYHQGWYQETLSSNSTSSAPIAFASVDCDYYESVKLSLAFLAPRLSAGGRVVVDDFTTWPGAAQAVHEFLVGCRTTLGTDVRLSARSTGSAVLTFGARASM